MPDILLVSDQEKRIKSLKRRIETWRVFLVTMYSILVWNEFWYPAGIFGTISTVFLIYMYWDPPIITSISLFFMIISLIDYSIPRICTYVSQPHQWTAANEKIFDVICESLVKTQDKICNQIIYFIDLKRTHPKMYFLSLISFFSFSAWIGYTVNNWVICFIIVTLISFYPGVKHNEVLSKFLSIFLYRVTDGIRSFTEKGSDKNK